MAERGFLALTEAIDVDDRDEVVQLVSARERRGFPDAAFGAFAVAEQDVGVVIKLIETRIQRHADADAQSLSQRTAGDIDERQARCGMSFEIVAEFAQFGQFADRHNTVFRPSRVEQGRGMAF